MDEKDLIRRCQAGDLAAFEVLLARYEKMIYNLTFRYFGNHHDASDLGQEAMVRIYHKISDFSGKSTFKTWLYRVVANLCLDELRRRKHQATSLDEIKEQGFEPPAKSNGPEESSENSERAVLVMEIMNQLSSDHRTILILKDLEELEYHEIAQVLGCNLGTVKSRINRARKAFREKLLERPRYQILAEGRVQA